MQADLSDVHLRADEGRDGWYFADRGLGITIGPFQSKEDAIRSRIELDAAYASTPEPVASADR
jgi:hypothetical protein